MTSGKKKGKESVESLVDESDKEVLRQITEALETYLRSEQVGEVDPLRSMSKGSIPSFTNPPNYSPKDLKKVIPFCLKSFPSRGWS